MTGAAARGRSGVLVSLAAPQEPRDQRTGPHDHEQDAADQPAPHAPVPLGRVERVRQEVVPEREEQGRPRERDEVRRARPDALPHVDAGEMSPPQMDAIISPATPFGHRVAIWYGPPDAQYPPISITARIDRNRTVSAAATPATDTKIHTAAAADPRPVPSVSEPSSSLGEAYVSRMDIRASRLDPLTPWPLVRERLGRNDREGLRRSGERHVQLSVPSRTLSRAAPPARRGSRGRTPGPSPRGPT